MERNITMKTMMALERTPAVLAPIPQDVSRDAKSLARVSPEKIPVRMPTRVTPIWTVERNLSGSEDSFNAARADLSPLDASALSLDFLEEIIAISAMEKSPLIKIRSSIIKASISVYLSSAMMVSAAFISSPRLTLTSASRGRKISNLEPNLIIPHCLPLSSCEPSWE